MFPHFRRFILCSTMKPNNTKPNNTKPNSKYTGRPSNVSLARRRNELPEQSNKSILEWLNEEIDNLSPGHYITIESRHTSQLNKRTILTNIYKSNMRNQTNFKFHTYKNGNWCIWYDPTPKPHIPFFLQSQLPTKPKQPKQLAGSIHATLQQICEYWHTSPESFDRLPFDVQLKKKIQAGIAIRKERIERSKLNKQFSSTPNQ